MFKSSSTQSFAIIHSEKKNIIQSCYFLAVLGIAIFISSCQKEALSNTNLNTNTSAASADAQSLTQQTPVIQYGATIDGPSTITVGSPSDLRFQIGIANQLGISCLREGITVPNVHSKTVPELNTKYKVLLHFNSPGNGIGIIPFRTDIAKYKRDLNNILNAFTTMPVVGIIENEESNRFYFSGSAQQYITQLSAGIEVMHAHNVKVANGGITSSGLNFLVYKDLRKQGKFDSARQFKRLAHVYPDSPSIQNRAAFIDTLLTNYRTMNLDYVNFHWKDSFPSTQVLNQTINYLKKRTNKIVISTEIGQLLPNPTVLTTHVQLCVDQQMPYIMWYSPDINSGKRGTPLQYPDGTLTESGFAYQDFISRH